MKVSTVRYERLYNLGEYEHEKVGIELHLDEGESTKDGFDRAEKFCRVQSAEFRRSLNTARTRGRSRIIRVGGVMERPVKPPTILVREGGDFGASLIARIGRRLRRIFHDLIHDGPRIAAAKETFAKGYDARKLGALFEAIQNAKDDIRLGTDTIFGLRKIIKAFDDLEEK